MVVPIRSMIFITRPRSLQKASRFEANIAYIFRVEENAKVRNQQQQAANCATSVLSGVTTQKPVYFIFCLNDGSKSS
jgi:hypothetical protein